MARKIFVLLFFCIATFSVLGQVVNVDRRGVAVKGYDVVAYFTQGRPVRGNARIQFTHGDATYYFSTVEHRELFEEDPEKYIPQYGGYCAYAVSYGSKASIQPSQWIIEDGRLFLNYSARVQKTFVGSLSEYIARADANWPRVKESLEDKK